MPKAVRVGDLTEHSMPLQGAGSPDVFIGGQKAWRAMPEGAGEGLDEASKDTKAIMDVLPTPAQAFAPPVVIPKAVKIEAAMMKVAAQVEAALKTPGAIAGVTAAFATLKATTMTLTVAYTSGAAVPGGEPAARVAFTMGYQQALSTAMGSAVTAFAGPWDTHACQQATPAMHGPGLVIRASKTIRINGLPAVFVGNEVQEAAGGPTGIKIGCGTVFFGDEAPQMQQAVEAASVEVKPSGRSSEANKGKGKDAPAAKPSPSKEKEPATDKPPVQATAYQIAEFVQVSQFNGVTKSESVKGGRQYVNLDEKTEPSTAHPEYGRFIQLKVRVQSSNGSAAPAGQTVFFSCLPGAHNRGGLAPGDSAGFGSAGGPTTMSATTDGSGWTPVIRFCLSTYGGDEFSVVASLQAKSSPSDAKTPSYVVWRRIFYEVLEMKTKNGKGKYDLSPAIQGKVKAGFADVFIDLLDTGKRALGDYHDNFDEVEKAFKWADGHCSAQGVPLKLHICVIDRALPWAGTYGAQKQILQVEADVVVFKSTVKIAAYDFSGHSWLVKQEYQDGTTWKPLPAKVSLDGARGDRRIIVDFTGTPLTPTATKKIKIRITYMRPGSYGGWGGADSLHLVLCRGTYEDMMSKSDADKQITVACIHEPGHAMGLVSASSAWHDASHSAHCKFPTCTMWYQSSPGNERFHKETIGDPGCRTFLRQKALDKNAMQASWKFPR